MTRSMMTQEGRRITEMDREIRWIRLRNLRIRKIHVVRVWLMLAMRIRRVVAIWLVGCLELALGIWRFFRSRGAVAAMELNMSDQELPFHPRAVGPLAIIISIDTSGKPAVVLVVHQTDMAMVMETCHTKINKTISNSINSMGRALQEHRA